MKSKENILNNFHRESTKENKSHWKLSLTYGKRELFALIVHLVVTTQIFLFTLFGNVFVKFNQFRLLYIFYIIWLPFDPEGISTNWILNYIYQASVLTLSVTFYLMYVPLSLIIMNHSCWGLDILLLDVKELDQLIQNQNGETTEKESSNDNLIGVKIRKIIEMHAKVLKWQSDVKTFIQFNFLVGFSFLSIIFCMCIYNLIINSLESTIFIMVLLMLMSQLFTECLMGNRVIIRIDRLITVLYDIKWHLMDTSQQKNLQMILIMAQNMKGFNGIFQTVSMKTFQKV